MSPWCVGEGVRRYQPVYILTIHVYYVLIMYTQSDQPSATPSVAEKEVDDTSGTVLYYMLYTDRQKT